MVVDQGFHGIRTEQVAAEGPGIEEDGAEFSF